MKQFYFIFLALFIPFISNAQMGNCDALTITDFKFNIFNPNEILVRSSYSDFDNFISYPGFQFVGDDELTLGFETVNFFGLGTDQSHHLTNLGLEITPGVPVSGRLELWSTFYEFLECEIDTSGVILLADTICYPVTFGISSVGVNTSTGWLNWTIASNDFMLADSIFFDGEFSVFEKEYCLPVGCDYFLDLVLSEATGEGFFYNLHYRNFLALGAQGLLTPPSPTMQNRFLIVGCANDPNSISKREIAQLSVYPNPATDLINIEMPKSLEITSGELLVYNALGQITERYTVLSNTAQIDCSKWPSGVYQIILNGKDGIGAKAKVVKSN
jgi:hypothetical protein